MNLPTMWGRGDFEDGYESYKTGSSNTSSPGWVPGYDPAWQGNPSGPGNSSRGRRHSIASDSGDTGIGTSCSDSVEDQSSSSTTPSSFQPLTQHRSGQGGGVGGSLPTAHVMPSPSSSGSVKLSMPPSPSSTSPWSSSCQLLMPATSPLSAPGCLDMKDSWPIRRWSSLTRLSAGAEKSSARESGYRCNPDSHGSLDRGLLYGYRQDPLGSTVDPYLPSSSSSSVSQGLLLRSPGANPCYRYNLSAKSAGIDSSRSSAMSSPMKPSSLDLNYSALPESRLSSGVGAGSGLGLHSQRGLTLGHQAGGGSPIQPAVRTQMWLSEQMEYRPGLELGGGLGRTSGTEAEGCGGSGLLSWQQEPQQRERERLRHEAELNQMLSGTSLPVNTLVKIKEGLLRQRELEIDRQKQQILQLHARIRENELRAQQVLQSQKGHCDDPYILKTKDLVAGGAPGQPSDRLCCDNEELGRKLAAAELEVLHLNDFLKQNTQKYTEDIRKLEEKMKTRDRYISSLKKKCQRESEQNREKQQRIETLEKYLADLPTLDEVQAQAQQLEEVQQKSKNLEETVSRLEKSLEESCALMKEKEDLIETQAKKEKELVATVNSLQQKVQQCLEDGVRLPMLDLKQLEVENTQLLEQQDHSSKLIEQQKKQIERLTQELTATESRLHKERGLSQQLQSHLLEKEDDLATLSRTFQEQVDKEVLGCPVSHVELPEAGCLLKEMSLCLLDLQALCSILAQRAQGKEPNLALLLGIKSMSVSGEENDNRVVVVEDELRAKLLEVGQLRRDIDELRKNISDRYAQDMGDNCVTQ
ncbi:centrosomal protein of 85 kDa-like isoform X2 [Myripristis murdjan]|uniref:centrosomal protein of 85 kDa-like isoform X2 n=1 Tax=Myripristis murdjan TaxID=586833 RepID=UPI0011762DCB|nr:centrosomal protein of 85 kDa-like isoform X2 [Myripristis murdjan]